MAVPNLSSFIWSVADLLRGDYTQSDAVLVPVAPCRYRTGGNRALADSILPGVPHVTTPFHAKYWAHSLLLARPPSGAEALSRSIGNARVDLNPHQVDAALFALRSPYSRGVLLADEVGLGKTIEAALILAQRWAERRRKILLIVPATLRKQWQAELEDKFFLPSLILETKSANDLTKRGVLNPFVANDRLVIASYQFVYAKRDLVKAVDWDLVVIDEAHRLRNIWKGTKTAEGIADAVATPRKLLLTATPLQNSLMELYGLVSIIDPQLFGGADAFQAQFVSTDDQEQRDTALRERIQHVCKRTLRRQVLEYIPFTNRYTHTADFVPSEAETQLYDEVSAYLQREVLVAIPNTRRKLMTLVLRKLLASSSAAIGATLGKFVNRLTTQTTLPLNEDVREDFESLDEIEEEWGEEVEGDHAAPQGDAAMELADLRRFVALAQMIPLDSKATKLVEVLPIAFELAEQRKAARKAVIFTESCKTQQYLLKLLSEKGYEGQIVLMNGANTDDVSKRTYAHWKERHKDRWRDVTSGSKSADMKAAIVDEFRDRATILLATESAAEGINLQFCSLVINYDLPWNPQRIEQRIGRCHRYGQKSDVLVVNFLNRTNAADLRVFELLDQKFNLFRGVFGASDDVLGVVESGVDLEKRILEIYQDCRTPEDIKTAFDALQLALDETIKAGIAGARRAFLENFDGEVHERLRLHKEAAKQSLDLQQQMLLDLAKYELDGRARFEEREPRFTLGEGGEQQRFDLDWQRAEANGALFFRLGLPLAEEMLRDALGRECPAAQVTFQYDSTASALERYCGMSGWLEVSKLTEEAVGRTEEHLLIAACDASGQQLPPDVAAKLFSLRGVVDGAAGEARHPALDQIRDALRGQYASDLATRNDEFFQEEAEKLQHRSDDLKLGLERDIRKLDKEISARQRDARKVSGLPGKLAAQKLLRTLETQLGAQKRHFYDESDAIRRDQDKLIAQMEAQLTCSRQATTAVLSLRWVLEPVRPT